MNIFYINLDSRPDRRKFIEDQFLKLGLDGIRVSAVSRDQIELDILGRYCVGDRPTRKLLTPSELACSLSHRKAWRLLLDAGLNFAVVLEDDACLSSHLPQFLAELDARPLGHDFIRLETRLKPTWISTPVGERSDVTLHRWMSYETGSAGYIISAKCARELLSLDDELFFSKEIDDLLFDPRSTLFQQFSSVRTVPGLCIPADFAGHIQTDDVGKSDLATPRDWKNQRGLGERIVSEAIDFFPYFYRLFRRMVLRLRFGAKQIVSFKV